MKKKIFIIFFIVCCTLNNISYAGSKNFLNNQKDVIAINDDKSKNVSPQSNSWEQYETYNISPIRILFSNVCGQNVKGLNIPKGADTFNFFYALNSDNEWEFVPLTKKEVNALTKESQMQYKNIIKADKYWEKATKYNQNSRNWLNNMIFAYHYNNYLYPVVESLGYYYFEKESYINAIYYFQVIPTSFENNILLILANAYFNNRNFEYSIENAKNYLKQANLNNGDIVQAYYFLMMSYFNLKKYNESIKYANILIYNYKNNKFKYFAYQTKYDCYKSLNNKKVALALAVQMAKDWGQEKDFERIKTLTSGKTRLNYFYDLKHYYNKHGNTTSEYYIDKLIANEKGTAYQNQKYVSTPKYNNRNNYNEDSFIMQTHQMHLQEQMLESQEQMAQQMRLMEEQQQRMYQQQYMLQQQQMLQNQMRYTEMMNY